MLVASHIVAGGVVGSFFGDPYLAFLLGLILHFILDAIPHFDTIGEGCLNVKQIVLIITDFMIGVALIIWIIKPDFSIGNPFIWGAIGGMIPDLFDNVPFWQEKFRDTKFGAFVHNFHQNIHSRRYESRPIMGMLTQYIVIGLSILIYLYV